MLIGNSLEPTPAITEKIPENHVSLKFEYINENVFTNHDEHLFEDFAGCSCSGNCLENTSKCSCLVTTENIIYSTDGRLHNVDPFTAQLRFLRECNRNCACDENICKNRLVQKGVTKQLIIFDTNTVKGLGVKAGEFIAKNSFVCEYTGDVRTFSNEEAVNADNVAPNNYETLQKNYILSVTECFQTSSSLTANENFQNYRSIESSTSSHEPLTKLVPTLTSQPCFVPYKCKTPPKTPLKILQTIVDATMRGNVGRLINHSCQPNLYMVPIRVETLVPRMCLFALMNINEGAELAYDYSGCPQVIGRVGDEASSLLVVVKKSKVGNGKNAKCGDDGDDDDDDDVKKCNNNNYYCRNKVKKDDDDDHHHHHLSGGGDDDAEDYLSGADNDDDDDASSTETAMKRCFCNSKLCRKYLPFWEVMKERSTI